MPNPWVIGLLVTNEDRIKHAYNIVNYGREHEEYYSYMTDAERNEYDTLFPRPIILDNVETVNYSGMRYTVVKWPESKYTKENISNIKCKLFGFWGHSQGGTKLGKECLSQWYIRDFVVNGVKYCCMEQYMMAQKAVYFGDTEMYHKIMNSNNPKDIKALGRKVRNFDSKAWDKVKRDIILTGNYCKFSQNKDLREFLIHTTGCVLVEASPYDKIWGIGLRVTDPDFQNIKNWPGQNLLGFSLMQVRDEISRVYQNYNLLDFGKCPDEFRDRLL